MKNHHFLPVFLTLIVSYISFHLYSASWIARNLAMSGGAARTIRIVFLLLALFSPFTMFLRRHYTNPALDLFYTAGYAWMGIILLAGSVFIFSDILHPLARRILAPAAVNNFGAAVLAALAFILIYSFYEGLKTPDVKEIRLAIPGLPKSMEGLKIAQISDMHIDSAYKLRQLSNAIDLINARKPDLVFITGDLLDPGLNGQARLKALIGNIESRLGVFGVLGNHEYYFGYEKSVACYKECGIKLIRNEAADAGGIGIIGLNDIATEKMTEKDITDILAKSRAGAFSLVMSHQPLMYETITGSGDFLVLSGHVHRGQIFPFHLFTRLFYKYFYGIYRIKNSFFYVTSGSGTWGPPMRFLAPSEIPIITLVKS